MPNPPTFALQQNMQPAVAIVNAVGRQIAKAKVSPFITHAFRDGDWNAETSAPNTRSAR